MISVVSIKSGFYEKGKEEGAGEPVNGFMTQQPPVRIKAKENFPIATWQPSHCNCFCAMVTKEQRPYIAMLLGYQIQGDTYFISSTSTVDRGSR